MTVTEPCQSPPPPQPKSSTSPIPIFEIDKKVNKTDMLVSQNAIDMLAQLFPHRKRSVLELILRRCDSDLLRAIEQCNRSSTELGSAFKPPALANPPMHTAPSTPPAYPPTSFVHYPKWLLPMSIPVTMGLSNLAPR